MISQLVTVLMRTKSEVGALYLLNLFKSNSKLIIIYKVFEETFQIFDKDCDGFITLVEIRTVMNALGFYPGDDIIRKSIQDIDNDSKLS